MNTLHEKPISFNLVQSSRKKGSDRNEPASREYRAVMKREATLGTDEVIAECIRDYGLVDKPAQLRRLVEVVLSSMVEHTLADGRSRSIDGFLTLRMDIAGNFARPDADFDPAKHAISMKFQTAASIKKMTRKSQPVNSRRRPHGKIESVYSPGGEIGKLSFGKDIVVEGHDLRLEGQDAVHLFVDFPNGTFEFGCDVKENTENRLVLAFPASYLLRPEAVIGRSGQIARFEFSKTSHGRGRPHGRRADISFVE